MAAEKEIDAVTGVETTGHVWDGDLKELNKPLPRWWLYSLYACIVWAFGYWLFYPAWPMLDGYTRGYLRYSQRSEVSAELAASKAAQARLLGDVAMMPVDEIEKNPDLMEFVMRGGAAQFSNNCAPCHGRGAQGFKGYPNLNDDDWLWGGSIDMLEKTIRFGIRSDHAETHVMAMPRFGIDQMLDANQISDTADYVLSLTQPGGDAQAIDRGKTTFAEQCSGCHGENAKGNPDIGAPNLVDGIWLHGSRKADIVETIRTGRGGVMPAWDGKLDPATIKMLAIYVHSLGGGK